MLIEMQSITCLKAPLYLSYLPYFGDIGPGISGTVPSGLRLTLLSEMSYLFQYSKDYMRPLMMNLSPQEEEKVQHAEDAVDVDFQMHFFVVGSFEQEFAAIYIDFEPIADEHYFDYSIDLVYKLAEGVEEHFLYNFP